MDSVKEVTVEQVWIDRMKMLVEMFTDAISESDLQQHFQNSEFSDLDIFLRYNNVQQVGEYFIRVKSTVTLITQDVIRNICLKSQIDYEAGQLPPKIADCFLVGDRRYVKVTPDVPMTRFLEILTHFPWRELMIPETDIVPYPTLTSIFKDDEDDKHIVVRMIALGKACDIWNIINVAYSTSNTITEIPMSISIDLEKLACCEEFCQMIWQKLTAKSS